MRTYVKTAGVLVPQTQCIRTSGGDIRRVVTCNASQLNSQVIISEDWSSLSLGQMTFANVQTAFHDTTFGSNSNYGAMSIVDTGSPRYRAMRHHLPGSYYTGDGGVTGVSYQPHLSRVVDYAEMSYWIRFTSTTPWGGGGKFPGLGGNNSKIGWPPAGGAPSPYGFTARPMWRAQPGFGGGVTGKIELVAYLYTPYLSSGQYGIDRHTGVVLGDTGGNSDGTWRHVKQVVRMNTSYVTDNNIDPATLVQGTDYLADGLHEVWVDDVRVWQKTDEVWRFYNDVHITRMHWSVFRGGNTTDWNGSAPGDVDISSLNVSELS